MSLPHLLCRMAGLMLLAALMFGCANHSQFIAAPPDVAASLPANTILLIYNHGSGPEFSHDYCRPNGVTTPPLIKQLAAQPLVGAPVFVYGLCFSRWGDYRHHDREGEPKVVKRAKAIERTVRDFQAQGIDGQRIFLLGHSAGGWASLLVARRAEVEVAGVIAFAPAFAGPAATRSEGWQVLRQQQVEYLRSAAQLDALVFAFAGDAFNPPQALAFLQEIPGLELVSLAADEIDGHACGMLGMYDNHRTVFDDCFSQTQSARIIDYFTRRIAGD